MLREDLAIVNSSVLSERERVGTPSALRGEWAAMNLRRGLLRLWMVCSIAWIAFVSIDAIRYWSLSWTLSDSPVRIARDVARDWESSIRPHLEWAFGPPGVVLIVGAALW
jgi:hypothetical protein